ncbi:MAG: universal stress protein [Chloroflexota bacterium]
MRLILAIDGSPSSTAARDLVRRLPWPAGTIIDLVAAYEMPSAWAYDGAMVDEWISGIEASMRSMALEELAAAAEPFVGSDWVVEQHAIQGRDVSVILVRAAATQPDLIVLGSRGRGPIRSMLLGSTSAEVARQAEQSVLVARSDSIGKVLVATDGSRSAEETANLLASWGLLDGLPAVALSVAPVSSPAYELAVSLYTLGNEPIEAQRREMIETHRAYAHDMARELSESGIPADTEVRTGDPAHEILEAARQFGADLIITGSRDLRGPDEFLFGSVARNVLLHAEASVLIVRPRVAEVRHARSEEGQSQRASAVHA